MENTRIPKPSTSGIRPLSKITGSRNLAPVRENKILTTNDLPKVPTQPRSFLRRRSKSVTDLRTVPPKPSASVLKNIKPLTSRTTGQKRPLAPSNNGNEVKPKIARNKIPDWDYKSRFQDLQQKYAVLKEADKENRSKLAGLTDIEQELTRLQEENTSIRENENSLEKQVSLLSEKNLDLKTENLTLKTRLDALQLEWEELNQLHQEDSLKIEKLKDEAEFKVQEIERLVRYMSELTEAQKQLSGENRQLKQELEECENLRRLLHNTIQDLKGNIRVFCRVRPALKNEEERLLCSLSYLDETSFEIKSSVKEAKQEFCFDKVFPPEAGQAEVFEDLSQLVQSGVDGYHVCVFAYGQTGSGKTYTMQGSSEQLGMIPRTMELIFEKIAKLQTSGWTYTVTASFLEIYNETIKDLLNPTSSCTCELRFNEGRGVTVSNLQIVPIASAGELKALMDRALKSRAVAATDFNEHSSRSHAVTKIHLEGWNETSKTKYSGSINLVDLAGSESAKTSSAERLTETKNINKSLSTLGNVMLALHNKDAHVPYRNSKLTFLLQSCLGGNSKTLMFVNISPLEDCYNESLNSLRFAAKVKSVKTVAKKNKTYMAIPLQTAKSTL